MGVTIDVVLEADPLVSEVDPLLQDCQSENGTSQHRKRKELNVTPLPLTTLFPLYCIVFAEPMIFTIIFPFIFFMVRSFGVPESEVGNYAGWIAGSFSIAQMLTSYPIGRVSDRIGRKPVLIAGLVGNVVTIIGFGFSKSLGWAMVTRSLCGLINGNVGIAKSVIAEITDSSNRGLAFSLMGFLWSLGGMFGPMIGGLLADPVSQYPNSWISKISIFQSFPFLLPCLLSSLFSMFGLITAILYMPETFIKLDDNIGDDANFDGENSIENGDNACDIIVPQADRHHKSCYHAIVSYALVAMCGTFFIELYPIWTATTPDHGGLGFSTRDIGLSITVTGAVSLIFQCLLYPRLERSFPIERLYQAGLVIFTIIHPLFPLLIIKTGTDGVMWLTLLVLLSIRTIASVMAFTSVMIMINDRAPTGMLGTMNGISQTGASLVRSISPPICGALYAWSLTQTCFPFNYNFVFLVTAGISFIALCWSALDL